MHYTRRLLERRTSVAFVLALALAAAAAVACSTTEDKTLGAVETPDAGTDGGEVSLDAGEPEVVVRDSAPPPFDGGPRAVACVGAPCATQLVTTRGAALADRAEGFCALLQDGTVTCWGADNAGQLGRGADGGVGDSANATRVAGLADVVAIDHNCARTGNGDVYCWGTGPFLKNPMIATSTERDAIKLPIPAAKKIALGVATGCALTNDGRVLCWGSNVNGQIVPFESQPSTAVLAPTEMTMPPGPPIRDLVVGDAAFAIREDGTFVSWGANPPLARISPLFPDPYPLASVLSGVNSIDIADHNACTTTAGIGYCWGAVFPRVVDPSIKGPRLERALPAPVVAPEPLVQIATTRVVLLSLVGLVQTVQPQRWCGCGASGDVFCWGFNESGQAGSGTKDHAYDAVRVVGLPAPAVEVKTTPDATCALLTNGKVFCWGANFYGQLGNGKIKSASLVPQEVVMP
jgi:alpha-tubulin suppressor-like RCC1 family protein